MSNHRYRLKYDLKTESGEFSVDQLKATKSGGTDSLIVVSCLSPTDGTYSQAIVVTKDGRTDDLMTPRDLFKAWLMMGESVARTPGLDPHRAELARLPLRLWFSKDRR